MVKLAEKERDSLEVYVWDAVVEFQQVELHSINFYWLFCQGVKNEAEVYMLKELSLLKWQEKASKLASEENDAQSVEFQANILGLEESLKAERLAFPFSSLL